jgi:hypothetical protein
MLPINPSKKARPQNLSINCIFFEIQRKYGQPKESNNTTATTANATAHCCQPKTKVGVILPPPSPQHNNQQNCDNKQKNNAE